MLMIQSTKISSDLSKSVVSQYSDFIVHRIRMIETIFIKWCHDT